MWRARRRLGPAGGNEPILNQTGYNAHRPKVSRTCRSLRMRRAGALRGPDRHDRNEP
jgi:hypothetical protein